MSACKHNGMTFIFIYEITCSNVGKAMWRIINILVLPRLGVLSSDCSCFVDIAASWFWTTADTAFERQGRSPPFPDFQVWAQRRRDMRHVHFLAAQRALRSWWLDVVGRSFCKSEGLSVNEPPGWHEFLEDLHNDAIDSHIQSDNGAYRQWRLGAVPGSPRLSKLARFVMCLASMQVDWCILRFTGIQVFLLISLCHAVLHFLIFVSLVCCPWLAELYKLYIELYTAVRRLVSKERGLQHEQPCVGLGSLTKMTELVEWTSTFLSKTPDFMNYVQSFESCRSLIFIAKRHLPIFPWSFSASYEVKFQRRYQVGDLCQFCCRSSPRQLTGS